MPSQSLIHDCAFAMARTLMDMLEHNYREEEQRELFEAFYQVAKTGIEAYCLRDDRMQHRLRPFNN